MKTVTLGRGGPLVAAIGQGTMGIGGFFGRAEDNDSECIRLLRLGIDLGMTVIDTAEVYGGGHAEELVGRAVAGVRDKVTIVTKFSAEHSRAVDVIAAAERSLKRLGTDYIDVYMPHWPNPQIPVAETLEALDRLVAAGKVRHIGLSNFSAADAAQINMQLRNGSLACLQNEYSLVERSVEDTILPFCAGQQIALMGYSPYCQGKLLSLTQRTEPLFAMAADYGISAAQLALAWILRSASVLVIPKAAREENLRANAAVLTLEVAQTDLDALSVAFATSTEYIATDMIDVTAAEDDRNVYKTLAEAIENRFGMVPSPLELSQEILVSGGKLQKPIKLRRDPATGRYLLIEGRTKYWGWAIAYGAAKPIPAIVEDVL
jgi:aryl-alcohol dehydrogenase-like predicted oxidoreductase